MEKKRYNEKRDNNPDQISRKFGKNVFIEVIQPNEDFERVTINLVSLNPNQTQKCMISTYVNMDDFVTLCQRAACGRFGQLIERAKVIAASSNKFPEPVWKRQGGKPTGNNHATAWMLSLHPATKVGDIIIKAERGEGKVLDNGLIQLIHSNTNDRVTISLTHDEFENIANISLMRIQAYITSRAIKGCYINNRRTSKGQPEEPKSNTSQFSSSGFPEERYDYGSSQQNSNYAPIDTGVQYSAPDYQPVYDYFQQQA